MLEDGSHTWWRDLFPEKNLRMIANVGWTGYGPLYGLGDTADEGQRIFPILWENKHVVYEDKDVLKAIDEDEIRILFNSSIDPCLVKPFDGNEYEYLVLPVRI